MISNSDNLKNQSTIRFNKRNGKLAPKDIFLNAQTLIEKICFPVSQELIVKMKNNFSDWRLNNIVTIFDNVYDELKLKIDKLKIKSNPRILIEIIKKVSLQDLLIGVYSATEKD